MTSRHKSLSELPVVVHDLRIYHLGKMSLDKERLPLWKLRKGYNTLHFVSCNHIQSFSGERMGVAKPLTNGPFVSFHPFAEQNNSPKSNINFVRRRSRVYFIEQYPCGLGCKQMETAKNKMLVPRARSNNMSRAACLECWTSAQWGCLQSAHTVSQCL